MRRVLKKSGHLGKTNWDAAIHVYDEAANVIETHEHTRHSFRFVSSNGITLSIFRPQATPARISHLPLFCTKSNCL
ncbi:MAG: hypothetical protein DME69_12335 [Verrucomicrobia bacterium]|nr:MAG: hypothetical protein DME69_12335 [Verrucomicrobiota bacterium]